MNLSVVLSIDVPKTRNIEDVVPQGPEWDVFEGDASAKKGPWGRGRHRAMSAVLDSTKAKELIYWYGLTKLDPLEENHTIKLTSDRDPLMIAEIFITPEKDDFDEERWERFRSKFRAASNGGRNEA